MISIHLKAYEGFDVLHDFYEYFSFQTVHSFANVKAQDRKSNREPEDYPEIMRRSWQFRVGMARCTLTLLLPTIVTFAKKSRLDLTKI